MYELPYFFEDYVDYNPRDEIFNAIENLSIAFSGVEVCFKQLFQADNSNSFYIYIIKN